MIRTVSHTTSVSLSPVIPVRIAMSEKKKALIAMSGGVDSSVAAYLMKEGGYECMGVTICFEGIEGESLLLLLDAKGICASSGSACTSGSLDPSHVLLAIGRPHEIAHGSLRLSLCEENTDADVDYMLAEIPKIVEYLRGMSPLWHDKVNGIKKFEL